MKAERPPPPAPRHVLLIKPSSLGDVLAALPVLAGIKRSFPQAAVSWLVTPSCAGVLEGLPGLDEIILFDRRRYGRMARSPAAAGEFVRFCRGLRGRGFDWVIDLQGLFRSGFLARVTGAPVRAGFADARELATLSYTHKVRPAARHAIDRNIELARQLGADARPEDYRLPPTAQAQAWLHGVLAAHGMEHRQYLVAVPGTRWPTKVYPARLWQRALGLVTPRRPIVLAGAGHEIGLCDEIAKGARVQAGGGAPPIVNLAGKTNLPQLVALIASAGGVVCGDSAAAYIAPAVATPFVMLIGPTRVERTGPYGPLGRALVAPVACQGCLKRRCLHTTCMQMIAPSEVAKAAGAVYRLA